MITLITVLAGCGMSESKFVEAFAEEQCNLADACGYLDFFGGDLEACQADWTETTETMLEDDCDYDGRAARDCIDEIRASTCDEGDIESSTACDAVCGALEET